MHTTHYLHTYHIHSYNKINHKTRCVCETQMPPIMVNSNDDQDHKDIYFDTSRKILTQEMTMCNMEALISIF